MRLVGREEIVGLARNAAARSSAFLAEGEARLLLSTLPTEVSSSAQRAQSAAGVVAGLARALSKRTGVAGWYAAYGDSPDELSTLAALGAARQQAEQTLLAADATHAAQCLLALAPCRLALACDVGEIETMLHALLAAGGPGRTLWICDTALQARFSLRRSGVAFRCHHPLLQSALEQRCRKDHIDLA